MRFLILMNLGFLLFSSQAMSGENNTPVQKLIDRWYMENSNCRGSYDTKVIEKYCDLRNVTDQKLGAAGWCYGEPNQPGNLAVWHPCPAKVGKPSESQGLLILNCRGKTLRYYKLKLLVSRDWSDEVLYIDTKKMTVRHNNDPVGPTITDITPTHYTWFEKGVLTIEGTFNRLNGTGQERITTGEPGILYTNEYEFCEKAPPAKF